MVHFSEKKIKGRKYLYAVKSIRLPDGKVVKLSKRVPERKVSDGLWLQLSDMEKAALSKFAASQYNTDSAFNAESFALLEGMRVDYQRILSGLSPAQKKDLFNRFTVNFTYESNAIEGSSLTLKDVAIVIHENVVPKGKELREIYETRNSREVVDLVLAGKLKVRESDMQEMHSTLVRDIGIPEGYKTVPNYLQGRQVVTTAPEEAEKETMSLFKWREGAKGKMHPLQLASRFHGRFERIHPFEDGNGRVGRFLLIAGLVEAGYPPLIIRKTRRLAYFNSLQAFDNGRPQKLDAFLLERYKETFKKFFEVYAKYVKPSNSKVS